MAGTRWKWAVKFNYRVGSKTWDRDMAGVMDAPADATSEGILKRVIEGCAREVPELRGAKIVRYRVERV